VWDGEGTRYGAVADEGVYEVFAFDWLRVGQSKNRQYRIWFCNGTSHFNLDNAAIAACSRSLDYGRTGTITRYYFAL